MVGQRKLCNVRIEWATTWPFRVEATACDTHPRGRGSRTDDDDGRITEFKVMLRPRKAVEKVQEKMAAMIAALSLED